MPFRSLGGGEVDFGTEGLVVLFCGKEGGGKEEIGKRGGCTDSDNGGTQQQQRGLHLRRHGSLQEEVEETKPNGTQPRFRETQRRSQMVTETVGWQKEQHNCGGGYPET